MMYKKLAKKGRFGDNRIAKTSNGSLWHVNKQEKKLIDDYGVVGERIVDMIGSGSTNPETGLKEQFLPLAPAAVMAALAVGSAAVGAIQSYSQTKKEKEQGEMQVGFTNQALSSLSEAEASLQDSLGSSLALPTLEAERALESVSDVSEKKLEEVVQKQDQISQATGFANIGMDEDSIKNIRKEFKRKREDVDIALTKSLSDVLSQFERQKFEMKSQRQQLEMQKRMANEQANTKYFGIF